MLRKGSCFAAPGGSRVMKTEMHIF